MVTPPVVSHSFELRVERQDELSSSRTSPAPEPRPAPTPPLSTFLPPNPVLPPGTTAYQRGTTSMFQATADLLPEETLHATQAPGYNTPTAGPPPQRSTLYDNLPPAEAARVAPAGDAFMERFRQAQQFMAINRPHQRRERELRERGDQPPFNPHFMRHHMPMDSAMSLSA